MDWAPGCGRPRRFEAPRRLRAGPETTWRGAEEKGRGGGLQTLSDGDDTDGGSAGESESRSWESESPSRAVGRAFGAGG